MKEEKIQLSSLLLPSQSSLGLYILKQWGISFFFSISFGWMLSKACCYFYLTETLLRSNTDLSSNTLDSPSFPLFYIVPLTSSLSLYSSANSLHLAKYLLMLKASIFDWYLPMCNLSCKSHSSVPLPPPPPLPSSLWQSEGVRKLYCITFI